MRNVVTVIVTFILNICTSVSSAEVPLWTKSQAVKHITDKKIIVICSGQGPAKDLSFLQALNQCNNIATSEANSEFLMKTVVVETESSSKLYSEVSSRKAVKGLKPKTVHEFTEHTENAFITYLQVEYDLSKAKVATIESPSVEKFNSKEKPVVSLESENHSPAEITKKDLNQSSDQTLILTSIPICKDVLIRGARPRTLSCSNPMQITVSDGDNELIIRPSDEHYLPRTLKVHSKARKNTFETESVQVQFERN